MIGYRRPIHIKGRFPKRAYTYNPQTDTYLCPNGQTFIYRTTNRDGYREYRSEPAICKVCPYLGQCTSNAQQVKTVTRHVWEEHREAVNFHRLTAKSKAIYKRRKETIERNFADAKQLHGHRYVRMRGLLHCLLSAACQNMKKMALLAEKEVRRAVDDAKSGLLKLQGELMRSDLSFQHALAV